jgi:Bacterial PH domain
MMLEKEATSRSELVLKSCWRAFFVYYVAIAICLFGPRLNPDVMILGLFHFSSALGTVLGLVIIAVVVYLRMGREYHVTDRGVLTVWRWPTPRQQEITWENLGEVVVRRGLTQSLLRVGNILIQDKGGGPEMFWHGLPYPYEAKKIIEARRT